MLVRILPAVAVLAIAGQTMAEGIYEPRQHLLARMSTKKLLGLESRALDEGYSPGEEICGDGDTCAEACGHGFKQCASTDSMTHCYNPSVKQQCCPGGTGDACDNGFFCSADEKGTTWCCPDGLSLKECAKKYGLPGPLTSEGPTSSTTTTTTKTTSTKKTSTTKKVSTTQSTETTETETTETTKTTKTTKNVKPTEASTHSISGEAASTSTKKSTKIRPTSESTTSISSTEAAASTVTSDISTSQAPITSAAVSTTATRADGAPASASSGATSSTAQGGSGAAATQDVMLLLAGAAGALAVAIL